MAERGPTLRWVGLVAALLVALGAGFLFLQTKDPMLLFFGATAALLVIVATFFGHWYPGAWYPVPPPGALVRVRCPSCRALNLEDAKYCGQCGKPM
ncbi:MAG TPA: zinc ribbon domain-containing protein [Candidatus Thermoplasmatota archaeon]|nr:zinc ribbon domain-containing protein [Candidatus Thermoplasmatota archaeon]